METFPAVFNSKRVRRTLHNGEWWFAISDVVEALTDSNNGADANQEMRKQDNELAKGWGQFATPLWLDTPGGRQKVDCTDTSGFFRIVQSIASPKAEHFKCWLAKVGYERVREFEDPELATNLTESLYLAKGYSETWIAKRMHGIAVRATLTNEWNNRGVSVEPEHAILAAEISKTTFDLTPSEYKEVKGLDRENLRDHMTDLELIFSMLGEAAAAEIARKRDAQGFDENRIASHKGGRIAGEAREKLEQETGETVVNRDNYLTEPESRKRLAAKKPSIS
ncbi:MAG: phage antirepressor protein [Desulfobulbaceae bacterium BRH_c16a]|nr:MAG: phage antirepressor protein [Desulfobulbaceae bacterium BRH_c16a]